MLGGLPALGGGTYYSNDDDDSLEYGRGFSFWNDAQFSSHHTVVTRETSQLSLYPVFVLIQMGLQTTPCDSDDATSSQRRRSV